jgi:hypothetical protein
MNSFGQSQRLSHFAPEEPRGAAANKSRKLLSDKGSYKFEAKLYEQFDDVHSAALSRCSLVRKRREELDWERGETAAMGALCTEATKQKQIAAVICLRSSQGVPRPPVWRQST